MRFFSKTPLLRFEQFHLFVCCLRSLAAVLEVGAHILKRHACRIEACNRYDKVHIMLVVDPVLTTGIASNWVY